MTTNDPHDFLETFKNHYQYSYKDLPNTSCEDQRFAVGDYVMTSPDEWAFVPEDPGTIDIEHTARRTMVDVYELYFAGIPEVTVTSNIDDDEYGDLIWCDVEITIPDDEDRAHDLAVLAADAFTERMAR